MGQFLYKTVKPTGGDYTSLESCMNANEQDLTGEGWFDVEIGGTWSSVDTTAVTIHNYTTTSADYINIYTTSMARHRGVYSTDYYSLEPSAANTPLLYCLCSYVTIVGIQARNTSTTGRGFQIGDGVAGPFIDIVCDKLLIHNCQLERAAFRVLGADVLIKNSRISKITQNGSAADGIKYQSSATGAIFNCTLGNIADSAILLNDGAIDVKNTYANSTGTCYNDNGGNGTITLENCASSDGSESSTTVAYSVSSGAYFTSVTPGSEDFHLLPPSVLRDAGGDLSEYFNDDIDGNTRISPINFKVLSNFVWDIGVHEYQPTRLYKTVKPTGGDYTNLETCLNANEQNLDTNGYYFDIEIDGDWSGGMDDSGDMTSLHNYTTSPDSYINIYTTDTARHKGVYDTDYYVIMCDNNYATITFDNYYVRFTGLQVINNRAGGGVNSRGFYTATGGNFLIDKCIIIAYRETLYVDYYETSTWVVFNTLMYQFSGADGDSTLLRGPGILSNCIIVNSSAAAKYAFNDFGAPLIISINSYFHSDNGTDIYDAGGTADVFSACASSDGGITGVDTVAYDTNAGAWFKNITLGSEDFHLTNGDSGLSDEGMPVPFLYTTDIAGGTYNDDNIGVFSYDGNGRYLYKTVMPSGGDYTTWEACMNANEQDLTGLGYFEVEIKGTWSSKDTTNVVIHNYTTTHSDCIYIFTDDANCPKGAWSTSKYIRSNTSNYQDMIDTNVSYVYFDGLQIERIATMSYGSTGFIYNHTPAIHTHVSNCFFRAVCGGYNNSYFLMKWPDSSRCWNNIWYSDSIYGSPIYLSPATGNAVYNNTFYGGATHIDMSGNNVAQNNLSINSNGNGYASFNERGWGETNVSDDASVTGSADVIQNQSVTFVDVGALDFRLASTDGDAMAVVPGNIDISDVFDMDEDCQGYSRLQYGWSAGACAYTGATQLKKTIKPTGGDYTNLETCLNANEQDLAAGNYRLDVEIDGDWSETSDYNTAVTIHNYGSDAGRYVNIYTTSTARHDGTYDSGAYRLIVANGSTPLSITNSYVRLTGLCISNTLYETAVYVSTGYTQFMIDKCFMISAGNTFRNWNDTDFHFMFNSIMIATASGYTAHSLSMVWFLNCTFIQWADDCYAIDDYYQAFYVLNSYAFAATESYAVRTTDAKLVASSDDTGTQGLWWISPSLAGFTRFRMKAEDLHINNSSYLKDVGNLRYNDLIPNILTDIDNQTRSGLRDLGADEYVITQQYYKEALASLPSSDTSPTTEFSTTEYTNVLTDDDSTYTNQKSAGATYLVMLFKKASETATGCTITWNGQSTLAPSSSTIYLQAYDRINTTWVTLSYNNSANANTDFTLTGYIYGTGTNYYDATNTISCRVYQQVT